MREPFSGKRESASGSPQATRRPWGLALVRASGDAVDVELLHDNEQDGDGNGNHDTPGDEPGEVGGRRALRRVYHVVQPVRDGIGLRVPRGREDDPGEDEVGPRRDEGGQCSVHNDWLRHRQPDVQEHLPARGAVDFRRLVDRTRNGVEEALRDVETQARTADVHENQPAEVQHIEALQDVVQRNH